MITHYYLDYKLENVTNRGMLLIKEVDVVKVGGEDGYYIINDGYRLFKVYTDRCFDTNLERLLIRSIKDLEEELSFQMIDIPNWKETTNILQQLKTLINNKHFLK